MTTLQEATLHCAVEIAEIWWAEDQPTTTLCGARAERYMDSHGTEWLLCATPVCFMKDLENQSNPEWMKVSGIEIFVVKCEKCLNHPDMPLLVLGNV